MTRFSERSEDVGASDPKAASKEAFMSGDNTVGCTARPLSFETLLDDPLVRMVMHADGVTTQDVLAALQIARKAVLSRGHEP
jgi:hypothetical protein